MFTFTEPLTLGEISILESSLKRLQQDSQCLQNLEMELRIEYNTGTPGFIVSTTTPGATDLSYWLERRPTDEQWESEPESGRERISTRERGHPR